MINWESGKIGNNSAANGTAFGAGKTATSNSPVKSLRFVTSEAQKVDKVYISANPASNTTVKLTIKVGETIVVNNLTINYNSAGAQAYGASLSAPLTGQVSFEFSEVNDGAINVKTLAMNIVSD